MTRRDLFQALAGAAVGVISGCGRTGEWLLFDATIHVDTPSGPLVGRSSLQVRSRSPSALLPGDVGSTTFLGEAPFVDLGNGRLVVGLLEAPYGKKNLADLLLEGLRRGGSVPPLAADANLWSEAAKAKPVLALAPANDPMFVTFADKAVPSSVRQVDPYGFGGAFGDGISLRSFTLAVTDGMDPAPPRILAALPWLDRPIEERLDPMYRGDVDVPLARLLTRTNFIKGST